MKIFSKPKTDYQKIQLAITLMIFLSLLFFIRGFGKYISLWFIQVGIIKENFAIPFILGSPLGIPYYIEPIFSFVLFITTWALATKIKKYQVLKYRYLIFIICFFGITFQYLWTITTPIVRTLIPYLHFKKEILFIADLELQNAFVQNFDNLMLFIMSFPLIILCLTDYGLFKLCNAHWDKIKELFKTWEYDVRLPAFTEIFIDADKQRKIASSISKKFTDLSKVIIPPPDIELGPNILKNIMVKIPGLDRTLNMIIVGAIGAGKTAALALPMINQDLHYMTFMINNFRKFFKRKDYISEEIRGSLFNGMAVIEPSNDLCKKVYKLAKAHGIPEESITYIDPTNPNTPSLGGFNAPVDKVAEMLTMIVSGIGEKADFFFEQSQRTHFKNHIYLLKEHDPNNKAGFSELLEMYYEPQLVWRMMKKLEKRIPNDIDAIEDRDTRNYWLILKQVKAWFDKTYIVETSGFGPNRIKLFVEGGPYHGEEKIIDTKSEHVIGLRNILDDIGKNILMRRVLFDESDFDFDRFLEYGGILLVNTAKGELSSLSDVLGKFALLSYQNAVFRRDPLTSSYNALYVDEFPDYIYEDFAKFPSQSRKYKCIVTVISQTTAQLQLKYGKPWLTTMMATLRNKMLYGDATKEDAEDFSAIMGTKEVFEESESDQEVSAMMDSPNRRVSSSYQMKEKEVLTPSELIFQEAFHCAVKVVNYNKPLKGQIIKANFVPKNEFEEATVKVNPEDAEFWLDVRQKAPISKNYVIQDSNQALNESIKDMTGENTIEATTEEINSNDTSEIAPLLKNAYQQPINDLKIQYKNSKPKPNQRQLSNLHIPDVENMQDNKHNNLLSPASTKKKSITLDQSMIDNLKFSSNTKKKSDDTTIRINVEDTIEPDDSTISFENIFGTQLVNDTPENDSLYDSSKLDLKLSVADTPENNELVKELQNKLKKTD